MIKQVILYQGYLSGLLINNLSDHELYSPSTKQVRYIWTNLVNKFIEVETIDGAMNNFVNELKDLNIYDQLDKQLTSDPTANYELFDGLLNIYCWCKHLPMKSRHAKLPQNLGRGGCK